MRTRRHALSHALIAATALAWVLALWCLLSMNESPKPDTHTRIISVTAVTEMGDPGYKVTLSDGQEVYAMACPADAAKLHIRCYGGGVLRFPDGTTYRW